MNEEDKTQIEEVIKMDISKLSNKQKLQLLERESPELFGLTEDFKGNLFTYCQNGLLKKRFNITFSVTVKVHLNCLISCISI